MDENTRLCNITITNIDIVNARSYAFKQHDIECNHWYDKELGLPYSYHLQMVADVGEKFKHLLPKELQTRAIIGCYLHDIVEDCRNTFNDIKKLFGVNVATDACRMCNNISGHTRDERANQWYYDKLNESIVTVFIKFCDRIANIEIGMLTNSSMYKKYAKEMDGFLSKLDEYRELDPMRAHLYKLKEIAE